MEKLELSSHAKINIGLQVLNRRSDGFHNINTVFFEICLADKLILSKSAEFSFSCDTDLGINNEDNLAYRAYQKILQTDGRVSGTTIELMKNIPAGGGLGGGSSNAAAVLKGLNQLWELQIPDGELSVIASELGSDVPFFLDGGTSVGKGRGEILKQVSLEIPYYILLVMPGIHVSTAAAYGALHRNSISPDEIDFAEIIDKGNMSPDILKRYFRNDFEDVVFEREPILKEIKDKLIENGSVFASMSGSGSSMYGFFDDYESLQSAEECFRQYTCYVCRPKEF